MTSNRLRSPALTLLVGLLALAGTGAALRAGDDSAEDLAARRQRIEKMSPAEKQELLKKQERFSALDRAEQARLRKLHGDLASDAQAGQLAETMQRYLEFLGQLNPPQRADLLELEPAARIEQIVKLQKEKQLREQGPESFHPGRENLDAIAVWVGEQIENKLPMESTVREFLRDQTPDRRRGMLLLLASMRFHRNEGVVPRVDYSNSAAFDELKKRLSKTAQEKLAARGKQGDQGWIMASWINMARNEAAGRFSAQLLADVPNDDLVKFFDSLKEDDRARLMEIPPQFRQDRLKLMYLWEHKEQYLPPLPDNLEPDFFNFRGDRGRMIYRGPNPPSGGGGRSAGPFGGGPAGGFGGPGTGPHGEGDGERRAPPAHEPPKQPPPEEAPPPKPK